MAGEWSTVRLGEVATVRSGYAFKSRDWLDSGIPVVKIANVKEGSIEMSGASCVSREVAEAALEFQLEPGDILIAMTGYIGDTAWIRPSDLPVLVNQRVGRFISVDQKRLERRFLFYVLRSPDIRAEIEGLGYGSAQPNVSPKLIHSVEIPLPPMEHQQRIADILGSLDDKIELNRRTNRVLEDMARAIFKAWFIDFLPVRWKAAQAGNQPSPPAPLPKVEGGDPAAHFGMPQEVFDQLPDRFTESELGPVPEGWGVVPVSELIQLIGGGTPKRKQPAYWGGDIPWFSVRDAPSESDVWVVDTQERITQAGIENSSAKIMRKGTTIISARGTVGRLALAGEPMAMNQSCYGIQGCDDVGDFFAYFLIRNGVGELQQRTHGSVFDTITRRTFDMLVSVRPTLGPLEAFEETVGPYLNTMRNNLVENRILAELRYTLLPKLISGELRVPDLETAI